MQPDHPVAAPADDDAPRPGTDRHRAVRQALADALALTRLQADLLVRLEKADDAGDDESVLLCHAELNHVMARMAETEQVRIGTQSALAAGNDLECAGCGAAAEPVYEKPRLLGYRCTNCSWEGDDPAAQDEQKRADALDRARATVEKAVERVGEALVTLDHRGKKAREEGGTILRAVQADLAALDKRLQKTR
jgi:hypothetical protein